VRFNFRELPETGTTGARAWPIVDVGVEGLDIAPQACLLDSGATTVRFGAYLADLCGIDLSGAPEARLAVGGVIVNALMAKVHLLVKDDSTEYAWTAPVWFCDREAFRRAAPAPQPKARIAQV
jgi:hypothetical protein